MGTVIVVLDGTEVIVWDLHSRIPDIAIFRLGWLEEEA